ncbi:MAG: hypothetical protein R3324_16570 [Halobacteriales archaeon]|nr:hypothetical protein [Halobacteriales archaeon]
MVERLPTEELESRLEELQYPVMRADAAAQFDDVTVDLGDGTENLGVVISELNCDSFTGPDELYDRLSAVLAGDSSLRGV